MHVPMFVAESANGSPLPRVVLCWALLLQGFVWRVRGGTRKKSYASPRSPVLATLGTGGFLKGGVLAALLQVGRRLAGD